MSRTWIIVTKDQEGNLRMWWSCRWLVAPPSRIVEPIAGCVVSQPLGYFLLAGSNLPFLCSIRAAQIDFSECRKVCFLISPKYFMTFYTHLSIFRKKVGGANLILVRFCNISSSFRGEHFLWSCWEESRWVMTKSSLFHCIGEGIFDSFTGEEERNWCRSHCCGKTCLYWIWSMKTGFDEIFHIVKEYLLWNFLIRASDSDAKRKHGYLL